MRKQYEFPIQIYIFYKDAITGKLLPIKPGNPKVCAVRFLFTIFNHFAYFFKEYLVVNFITSLSEISDADINGHSPQAPFRHGSISYHACRKTKS